MLDTYIDVCMYVYILDTYTCMYVCVDTAYTYLRDTRYICMHTHTSKFREIFRNFWFVKHQLDVIQMLEIIQM